jgi:hypothetical protein
MNKILGVFFVFFLTLALFFNPILAQNTATDEAKQSVATESAQENENVSAEITPSPRADITQIGSESVGHLEELIRNQELGSIFTNPLKYAIRASVDAGVPANTIVLLLMLPAVTLFISAARHLIGLRGFGILLPASLSVVFVAIGPILGIVLFLVIVSVSILQRMFLRQYRIKLQYLPKMSLMLLLAVLGVMLILFTAPVIKHPSLTNVSIFPVLILVLLAEDFSKVQIGKSAKTAYNLLAETLLLAFVSYLFITLRPFQEFALKHPEIFLTSIFAANVLLGKYIGLRFIEYLRFRKLISG